MDFDIASFDKSRHDREGFDCGVPELNKYLLEKASQDVRNHYASPTKPGERKILGYYTFATTGEDIQNFPENIQRKMPKYLRVPAILLGRLAVDKTMQGQGLGFELMADALARNIKSQTAWAMMIVDAKDDKSCAFYAKFGFEPCTDNERHLYAERIDLERLVAREQHAIDSKQEVKILVSSEIIEEWKTVAKAKGLSLTDFLIKLANDDTKKFFAEYNASERGTAQQKDKEPQAPSSAQLLGRLKKRDDR
jgi:predicted GNAT family N-acyltransferase